MVLKSTKAAEKEKEGKQEKMTVGGAFTRWWI